MGSDANLMRSKANSVMGVNSKCCFLCSPWRQARSVLNLSLLDSHNELYNSFMDRSSWYNLGRKHVWFKNYENASLFAHFLITINILRSTKLSIIDRIVIAASPGQILQLTYMKIAFSRIRKIKKIQSIPIWPLELELELEPLNSILGNY